MIFAVVLLALFAIELLGPVQTHVIQPFTAAIAQTSAIILQIFDSSVQAQGIVLRDAATGAAVSIQPISLPTSPDAAMMGKFAQTDKNSHRISNIFVTCAWKNAHGR